MKAALAALVLAAASCHAQAPTPDVALGMYAASFTFQDNSTRPVATFGQTMLRFDDQAKPFTVCDYAFADPDGTRAAIFGCVRFEHSNGHTTMTLVKHPADMTTIWGIGDGQTNAGAPGTKFKWIDSTPLRDAVIGNGPVALLSINPGRDNMMSFFDSKGRMLMEWPDGDGSILLRFWTGEDDKAVTVYRDGHIDGADPSKIDATARQFWKSMAMAKQVMGGPSAPAPPPDTASEFHAIEPAGPEPDLVFRVTSTEKASYIYFVDPIGSMVATCNGDSPHLHDCKLVGTHTLTDLMESMAASGKVQADNSAALRALLVQANALIDRQQKLIDWQVQLLGAALEQNQRLAGKACKP